MRGRSNRRGHDIYRKVRHAKAKILRFRMKGKAAAQYLAKAKSRVLAA